MPPAAPPAAAAPAPGQALFYQVLTPSGVLAATGQAQLEMLGPFPDYATAWGFAAGRPGAIVAVTLVLQVASGRAAVPPMRASP
jgi:hypothetical protein